MATTFNWLHVTDVHFGLEGQGWLWPKVKHDLLGDLRKVNDRVGGFDVVFFTGDFTQSGNAAEFDLAAKELEWLWGTLWKSGRAPVLCPIPGNHDLTRPEPKSAIATAFRHWWDHDEVRLDFWKDPECELRTTVDAMFSNYSKWLCKVQVPQPEYNHGALPGDFAAVVSKGEEKIGIVGLNSAFLQVAAGAYEGLLDLHVSQVSSVCEGDIVQWVGKTTLSVLLTHHPPTWLRPGTLDHFRQEIYPAGRFYSQFCGHLHQSCSYTLAESGGVPRRLRQGPSVFGLEKWAGATPTDRIHGYVAGRFDITGQQGAERIWPRTCVQAKHGGLRMCPDQTYDLDEDDSFVERFHLGDRGDDDENPNRQSGPAPVKGDKQSESLLHAGAGGLLPLLEAPPDPSISRTALQGCPRLKPLAQPQHKFIRLEEQSQFEHALRKNRCVWLVADWGAGKEGFLSVGFDRLRAPGEDLDVFHLRCDEASDCETLQALFPQQFGMSLQAFCAYAMPLKSAFLVLDGLPPCLSRGDDLEELRRIIGAIIDYCPELGVVVISRICPTETDYQVIKLSPLEVPDVRTYLSNHPDASHELTEPDVIDKLHERSDGLPMHLDRMLKALKVSSLDSVLEAELDSHQNSLLTTEEVPKALVDAVASLATSPDRRTKRSLRLLKVLSLLPYGETVESMAHYLPSEPFFTENAIQLHELALLDVIPLQLSSPKINLNISMAEQSAPKLLKVPRQVRDHVQSLISDGERDEFVDAGAEQCFGRKWREGKVKMRDLPVEHREYVSSGPGNEFAIIHQLLQRAREKLDVGRAKRAARLAVLYCRALNTRDRYRDATIAANALLQQIDRDKMPELWGELAAIYAEALRMVGRESEALRFLQLAIEAGGDSLNASARASVQLSMALSEMDLHHPEEAVRAAEEVKRLSGPTESDYLMAELIIIDATLEGPDRVKRLQELEREARKNDCENTANTIALELAKEADDPGEEEKWLDRVLESEKAGYNNVRAIVAKAVAARSGSGIKLKTRDLAALCAAYSYTHTQRFTRMFDDCHDALWDVLEENGNLDQLLRLFRHSSFVWRIRGEDKREADYLAKLSKRKPPTEVRGTAMAVLVEIKYFWRRVRVVLVGPGENAPPA